MIFNTALPWPSPSSESSVVYVSVNLFIIGPDNAWLPAQRNAITWADVDVIILGDKIQYNS